MNNDLYKLEEFIELLRYSRDNPNETIAFNYPKAFLTLALEIDKLKDRDHLHDM